MSYHDEFEGGDGFDDDLYFPQEIFNDKRFYKNPPKKSESDDE